MSLEKEFDKWQSAAGDAACFIWLDGGSKNVVLLLDGNDEFNIRCPEPGRYEFQSSSKGLTSWVAKVNAAIKAHPPATFSDLLSTAADLHKNKKSKDEDEDIELADKEDEEEDEDREEDDGNDDDDDDDDDEDAEQQNIRNEDDYMGEDFDLESDNFKEGLEVLRKRKRWAQKEAEIRNLVKEQERKKADLDKGKGRQGSKVEQIFSSTAATGVLTNDLLEIMQNCTELGFSADPIEDNIYHWRVKMFNFDPQSSIGKDLAEIDKAYSYSYVELGVELTMDLYPFYPPIVKVIRPRLKGFMMGRVTSMEILKLSYWDPVKGMKYVLGEIRNMLQAHGKLDVNNPMNDTSLYPAGAYTRLEYLLLRLELLCETEPRANLKYVVPEKLQKQPTAKAKQAEEKDGKFWARGTGYGHGHTGKVDWDVQAYLAAQKQKDRETQSIIEAISTELQTPNENVQFEIIEESCLVPVLENYFRNDSLLDMGRHALLYIALLGVVKEIAKQENLLPLLDTLPNQTKSVHLLLSDLDSQARVFLKRLTNSSESGAEVSALSETVVETHALVQAGVERMAADIQNLTNSMKSTQYDSKTSVDPADLEKNYMRNMKKLQFDIVDIDLKGHHYNANIAKGGAVSKEKVLRLAQEQGSISTSLPLNYSSSVFVRIDEQQMDVMKVLITAPDDTPYSGGCFLFDIYFPTNYPNGPPLVNLQTTGSGSVRFNPNLYNCGKVCLSLLGTWSGAESENWNKDTSTLLQVLVSIQSLILVPTPFFNEPGYESQIGTPRGDQNSRQYNEVIRVATIEHAMVGQLRKPPQHFDQIIRSHFWYKRDVINTMCDQWLADAQHQHSSKGHHAKLLKVVKDLRDEFGKLTPPV